MSKILLVDDDPLQAFLRKTLLERRFPDVERVADAAEALCLVEQPQFARKLGLVIAGLNLPGFGGAAFVAELLSRLPLLPVLVLGGARETASEYSFAGVRFLSRPIANEDLLAAADQMLGQALRVSA